MSFPYHVCSLINRKKLQSTFWSCCLKAVGQQYLGSHLEACRVKLHYQMVVLYFFLGLQLIGKIRFFITFDLFEWCWLEGMYVPKCPYILLSVSPLWQIHIQKRLAGESRKAGWTLPWDIRHEQSGHFGSRAVAISSGGPLLSNLLLGIISVVVVFMLSLYLLNMESLYPW